LGGVDGLIHVSELDWQYVDHPRKVLNVGDEVDVYILKVDREQERIGLSRKQLLPDPWYHISGNLRKGDTVQGTVTSVEDFGAFVNMGEGVEGLIHVSEMSGGESTLSDLESGTPVIVSILEVDQSERQVALRLRDTGTPSTESDI
jgi:small subunit ribosomal protein S1